MGEADRVAPIVLTIAMVILLATPAARVVISVAEYVRERDWLFVALTRSCSLRWPAASWPPSGVPAADGRPPEIANIRAAGAIIPQLRNSMTSAASRREKYCRDGMGRVGSAPYCDGQNVGRNVGPIASVLKGSH